VLKFFAAENADALVDRMLFTDLMTRMPDHLLAIGDRMSMAHSLEARPVLVDHEIVEYAASIPAELKLKNGELKHMLKAVAARYLPKRVIARRKQGFTFPLGQWMRSELRPFLARLVDQSRFVEHGIFNREYIRSLVDEHVSGRVDHSYRLWILINLEFWYRSFIDGESIDSQRARVDALLH
jgi:asparagine synthase (glutamine-hydrolysing)